ncbi:MAG: hypothetical protein L6Q54_14845 [Leptospiraceae bacterium]|nr:hypothetical protein [Leptospiraceae bacterium]MCK6382512.1 hypothetical protein [Leptospiraceae bacterium]NUM41159.1 hypothetical protein [Leptospiraceae bacterium]
MSKKFQKPLHLLKTFGMVLIFFCKVVFIESGIFASSLYFQSQICECNHSSDKEIHNSVSSSPEDLIFQSKTEKLQIEENKEFPNCHSAKNNETHKCSCTKKKHSSNSIQSQSMNPNFLIFAFSFTPQIESSIAFASDSNNLLNGHSQIPDEPPKNF